MLDGESTVETVTVFIVLPNLVSSCYQTRCGTSNATVYTQKTSLDTIDLI